MVCSNGKVNISETFETKLVEPRINREASNYVTENYGLLLEYIVKQKVAFDKANDCLHDIYISIVESEDNGEGFKLGYSKGDRNDSVMTVEQFVYGRIKGYCKNSKYSADFVESKKVGTTKETYTMVQEVDAFGNKTKLKRVKVPAKDVYAYSIAASSDGRDLDQCDDFQKAYMLASSDYQDEDDVDLFASLRENMELCIDICNLHRFDIVNLFKNIDSIGELLEPSSKKCKDRDGLFNKVKKIAEVNDQFCEALEEVILSYKDKVLFNQVLDTVLKGA